MRPYLAVIHDGFRQAFATWILWVLLLMITFLLIGVAPVGIREDLTVGLAEASVRDWRGFLVRLQTDAAQETPSPGRRIWNRLPAELQGELRQLGPLPNNGDLSEALKQQRKLEQLREAVNEQMRQADFYDAEAWRETQLNSGEAGPLLQELKDKPEELSERELQRLNRLLVEAAFPDQVQVSPRTSLVFRYLGYDISPTLPLRREQLDDMLRQLIAWLLGWVVGGAGIVVAIVVTAPIIPQMFDIGSLHLLLSKPISRSLLFLAKFVAGCAFILIIATYLIGGIWLILGFRFNIWEPRLLWSIPIYTFVFAVYYSVSALAGIIYRGSILASAIMSIGVSCLFWAACFLVGTGKVGLESSVLNKMRVVQILPAGESLFSVNEFGFVGQWNGDEAKWVDVFDTEEQRQLRPAMYLLPALPPEIRPVGPLFDSRASRLLTIQRSFREGKQVVYVGTEAGKWEAVRGATAPGGSLALLQTPQGHVMAVSSLGVYRLVGDPTQETKSVKLLGMNVPMPGGGPFRSVGPTPAVIVTQPFSVAMDHDTGDLAIYSRGTLTRLKLTDKGIYERQADQADLETGGNLETGADLETKDGQAVVMAYGGSTLVLARDDGQVEVRDAQSLEILHQARPEPETQPRFAYAAPGGRWFAIVFHNGNLWLWDAKSAQLIRPPIAGQGDVSAAAFPDGEQLLVADRIGRVSRYRLESWELEERFTPTMGVMEKTYRFLLVPMYTVFPKPGELNKTFQYLLSGKETTADGQTAGDLSATRVRLRPWAPLWSSLVFMCVVLLVSCVYIERQQF